MIDDIRYATRSLIKKPGFTAVAVITLALGIGASTAIFSVLDAVLLRPMPYPQQDRIVEITELNENGRAMQFAEPNFHDLKTRSRSFEALAQYSDYPDAVSGGSEPIRTTVAGASAEFFRVLGVSPLLGRVFGPEEAGDRHVAVVSQGFWHRLLGSRTDLADVSLRFGSQSFAVIGVLPANAGFPPDVDVWYPSEVYPFQGSRTAHNWSVAGRLKPGVTTEQARSEVAAIGRQLKAEHGVATDAASFGMTPLRERIVKDVRGVLMILCGAVGLLLVIACSNVANLLLVRASGRRKEVALRAALGASRARLARQFIAESLVLTLVAGVAGVLLAFWGVDLIVGLYAGNLPQVGEIGVNSTVLGFTLLMSLVVGVVLGLVPAFHTSRRQLQADLQDAGRGQAGSRSRTRARDLLIVSQVALTLMLLVGAGLLARSFQRLMDVDPGFEPENAVAMTVSTPYAKDEAQRRQTAQLYQQLVTRLAALPGVLNVGGTNALPMSGTGGNGTFLIQEGGAPATTIDELSQQMLALRAAGKTSDADYRVASAGYFATMGISLLQGRTFQESDGPDSPHAALVSQSLAKKYWPNGDAIGKQIQYGNMDGDLRLLNVVGVVGDVRADGLHMQARPTVYVNYFQRPTAAYEFSFVLRARGDAAALIDAMRREARALNPEMPTKFQRIEQLIASSLDNRRFSMVMLGLFAGVALALAMVGLYGIMAFITSERTTEIGIRMALGAQRTDMLALILRQSFTLVLIGIGVGIAGAFAATRVVANLLYGIGTTDIATYVGVVAVLGLAAFLASYIPARRAMSVDPMVALRHE
ncbi:MAG: Acidobacterial duplicated orphan permease (function unknown) [uncultured Chthoniobacterales bacterium]|uniref:ABC-type antimicrobial peptide transport system, permease component n=1 Tax=uncultured Chthoniobacterales bacterium TaxID=1836801 RepID=A0A6J4HFU5_9BACT|nr:MAG: Acidobacterial duplicated orphan permease (function unknown) [uncultured Chthoniobacterales bacterium]